jgi:hypothetical protein
MATISPKCRTPLDHRVAAVRRRRRYQRNAAGLSGLDLLFHELTTGALFAKPPARKSLMPAGCFSISFKHQSSRRPMTDRHRMSLQSRYHRLRRLR